MFAAAGLLSEASATKGLQAAVAASRPGTVNTEMTSVYVALAFITTAAVACMRLWKQISLLIALLIVAQMSDGAMSQCPARQSVCTSVFAACLYTYVYQHESVEAQAAPQAEAAPPPPAQGETHPEEARSARETQPRQPRSKGNIIVVAPNRGVKYHSFAGWHGLRSAGVVKEFGPCSICCKGNMSDESHSPL